MLHTEGELTLRRHRSKQESAGASRSRLSSSRAFSLLRCCRVCPSLLRCHVCPSLLHRRHDPSPLCRSAAASAPLPCTATSRKGRRGYLRRMPARRRWPLQVTTGGSGGADRCSAHLASRPCCVNRWRLGHGVAPVSREKTYVGWARVQDGPTRIHF
jgi:hypothetical protein